ADADSLDVGAREHLVVVGEGVLDFVRLRLLAGARFVDVSDGDDPREVAVRAALREGDEVRVRDAARADDADADRICHRYACAGIATRTASIAARTASRSASSRSSSGRRTVAGGRTPWRRSGYFKGAGWL